MENIVTMLWIVVPLLTGIIALVYVVVANLLRVWMDHRVKITLLELMQEDPRLGSGSSLYQLVDGDSGVGTGARRVDYVAMGIALAGIGTVSALAAWGSGAREWMVGAYFGGVTCVVVGFILTVLGLVMRYLGR